MDKETVQERIDAILQRLREEQTALESLPARRDRAYQAYLDLEALRMPPNNTRSRRD